MIINISSKQNTKIKEIGKLISDNSYRKERKEFVIEGFHLLEMALEDKLVKGIFSLEPIKNIDEKITNYIVSEDILKKISTQKNQALVGKVLKGVIEGESKSNPKKWSAHSTSGKLIHFDRPENPDEYLGNFADIRITEAKAIMLYGEIEKIYN